MIFSKGANMDRQEFWQIMEWSLAKSHNNQQVQENLVIEKLVTYTPSQIIDFEIILRQLLKEANDYTVAAAEKIMQAWVSDNPYLYFRCWLISQGKNTFEATIKNPDFLADKTDKHTNTDFETLLYVADKAYQQKTGKKVADDSFPRNAAVERDPQLDYDMGAPPTKGTEWQTAQLPTLYPKLWARFH